MNTYTIVKKTGDIDWYQIPSVSISNPYHEGSVDICATGQLCYDDSALYVRLAAKESHIRAEYTGLLDAPCEDSCLEFFFSPISGDTRYFNIEYNVNSCVYLGIGSCLDNLVRLIPEFGFPFKPEAKRFSDGWEITYHIPFSFIRQFFPDFNPISNSSIRGNFYKCGDLTEKEHYFSWNPLTGDVLSFHRPCDFGILTFE